MNTTADSSIKVMAAQKAMAKGNAFATRLQTILRIFAVL